MVDRFVAAFPGLPKGGYTITSAPDQRYNCIAWAAGESRIWWWPGSSSFRETYWPVGVAREESLAAFRQVFALLGYVECESEELEEGFEKVALFADDQGTPLHAARQRPSSRWTSKVGELEDIEHDLRALEGAMYGSVSLLMKRPTQPAPINE